MASTRTLRLELPCAPRTRAVTVSDRPALPDSALAPARLARARGQVWRTINARGRAAGADEVGVLGEGGVLGLGRRARHARSPPHAHVVPLRLLVRATATPIPGAPADSRSAAACPPISIGYLPAIGIHPATQMHQWQIADSLPLRALCCPPGTRHRRPARACCGADSQCANLPPPSHLSRLPIQPRGRCARPRRRANLRAHTTCRRARALLLAVRPRPAPPRARR